MNLRGWLERGSAMVESALTFPVLLMAGLALVQFALFYHAENVITGAVQDGARVAAAEGGTLDQGVQYAQQIIDAGLNSSQEQIQVQAIDGGDAIAVTASGRMHLIVPWVADATLPLHARAVMNKEQFHAGP
ncbi:MAG TPA: TadE/TadG family type IV pilus assembly protein [Chloroflexota bacterium]|nr:TadE/TadG family type IV pilus assembly protein [Chloroflexota bacterium]